MNDVQNHCDGLIAIIAQPKLTHHADWGGDVDIDRQQEEFEDAYNIRGIEQYPLYDEYNQDAAELDELCRYRDTLEV